MINDHDAIRRRLRRVAGLTTNKRGTPESQWFWDHYDVAVQEIVDFCEPCGLRLSDLKIADIGCGDGIMALGLCHRVRPARLVGFDIVPTNVETLLARSEAESVSAVLPSELEFLHSGATSIPAPDGEFDMAYSWSAFEHVADPVAVLKEIRRILRPGGHFFLQLWPFYHSAKGSHLWDWFEEDFHHLLANERDLVAQIAASDRQPQEWTSYMTREFEHLNRITVDELQRAVLSAGFDVVKIELLSSPIIVAPRLARYSWADLGIGGIKLLARLGQS
jgi:ubiquinone/menaquinone biosynthesis C-methylase UbiE